MQRLDVATLSPTSAGAVIARVTGRPPEFLVASHNGLGLIAARWRRSRVVLPEAQCLDDHVLSYCALGRSEGTLVIDGVPTRMKRRLGSIAFLPANRPVQWSMDAAGESVHVHLYIPAAAMQLPDSPGPGAVSPTLPTQLRDAWIESYFRLMIAELESCLDDARVDSSKFLDETGGLLIGHLAPLLWRPAASVTALPDPTPHVSALRPFILRRIETFVNSNLAGDIGLESLAEIASMSVGHFLRSFHKALGSTPHQYVLERRLDRACALLKESADQVSTIARRCGFASAAHFSAIFHLHRGCTPSQFRRGL
ncbi:MAG: AraC family transcriptional regulator [Burkholderiaceae bacterium]